MKKTKILSVLGVLFAMSVTACGGGGGGGKTSKSNHTHTAAADAQWQSDANYHWKDCEANDGGKVDRAAHSLQEKADDPAARAASCSQEGLKVEICSVCGYRKETNLQKLDHEFGPWTTVAADASKTCGEVVTQERTCKNCPEKETRTVPLDHNWGEETKVDKKGDGYVDYYTANCSVDQAFKLRIPTEVGGVYEGTERKSNTPTGYTKLKGNGSISWKFNLAGTKSYMGIIYHRACMDAYTANSGKTMGYYTTSGDSTRPEGNFNFFVNSTELDKSPYIEKTFAELTEGGEVDPNLEAISGDPGPYSKVALVPIGAAFLEPGDITFKYQRTGSYNMVMSDLVFIGKEYIHEHAHGNEYQSDDENHWFVCTNPGCPAADNKIEVAAHEWGPVNQTQAPTHTAEGAGTKTCTVCGKTVDVVIPAEGHSWGDAQTVPAGGAGQVAFSLAQCTASDGGVKAELAATDGTFLSSSNKGGTPSGFIKIADANGKVSWTFTVPGQYCYRGMLYQHGAMDSWTDNTTKSYANTNSRDATVKDLEKGNFDVVVNNKSLDKTQWIDVPFSTLLAEGDDSSSMGNNYSPIALAPIGECVIINGVNTITYERLGSFNLVIDKLVFIGEAFEHVHQAASEWSSDEDQHWHACTAPGCPTGKVDAADHTWVDDTDETDVPATCDTAGTHYVKCSVCGKKSSQEVAALGHTWDAGTEVAAEGDSTYTKYTCTRQGCSAVKMAFAFKSYVDSHIEDTSKPLIKDEATPNAKGFYKLASNKNFITFKFNYTGEAVTAKLYQYGICDNWTGNNNNSGKKYTDGAGGDNSCNFQVNYGEDFTSLINMDATKNTKYSDLLANGDDTGLDSSKFSLAKECLIGEMDLVNGANQFRYKRNGSYNLAVKYFAIVIG